MAPVYTVPMRNIVPNLVYSARGDEVSMVVIDGRIVLESGRLLTIDAETVLRDVQEAASEIGPLAEAEFRRVGGTNARFMDAEKL